MRKHHPSSNKPGLPHSYCQGPGACSRCLALHCLHNTLPDCCFKTIADKAFEIWVDTHLTEMIQENVWSN
ncbi:MAG: hypothetical protein R6U66_10140 [Bacteroidales bacterium]